MSIVTFSKKSHLPYSAERVYDWHMREDVFRRLIPPWEHVAVLQRDRPIQNGAVAELLIGRWSLSFRWKLIHDEVIPGRQFVDYQVKGPFKSWRHTHRFVPDGNTSSYLEDVIQYEVPFGELGLRLTHWLIERKLVRLFDYRHSVTLNTMLAEATRAGTTPATPTE